MQCTYARVCNSYLDTDCNIRYSIATLTARKQSQRHNRQQYYFLHMISAWNCFRKRTSFSENKRKSRITYFKLAILSMPIPKAKPVYFLLSILQFSKTLGSTMPQPNISTQPLYLHMEQPDPPQMVQDISISAEGSVKG